MRKITRTLALTKVDFSIVKEINGELGFEKQEPRTMVGALTREAIQRKLNKEYKGENVVIQSIVSSEEIRAMNVDTFIKYSELVSQTPEEAFKPDELTQAPVDNTFDGM